MTDIEALRARMREAAVAVENAQPAPRDPVFSDPQLEAMELFRALASPANVKALDAYTTRLREDLDRVTRERDEARAEAKIYMDSDAVHIMTAARRGEEKEAAEAALAKRDEEVERLKGALWSGICALKEVERNTHYEFDGDYTPENERLIPRLCAAYKGEPNAD